MKFRQVHLDFHTSGQIPDIGGRFSKEQFQAALKIGHVDSIKENESQAFFDAGSMGVWRVLCWEDGKTNCGATKIRLRYTAQHYNFNRKKKGSNITEICAVECCPKGGKQRQGTIGFVPCRCFPDTPLLLSIKVLLLPKGLIFLKQNSDKSQTVLPYTPYR